MIASAPGVRDPAGQQGFTWIRPKQIMADPENGLLYELQHTIGAHDADQHKRMAGRW